MIVVWDTLSGAPIKTIFNPHLDGAVSIDMSPDAMFLVTLSSPDRDGLQEVALWEWTVDHEGPLYSSTCPQLQPPEALNGPEAKFQETEAEPQPLEFVKFNQHNVVEFVTTGPDQITFWSWETRTLEHQTPPRISKADFGARVGDFTHTAYLPGTTRAVSGTTAGNLVMWDTASAGPGHEAGQPLEAKTTVHSDMISRRAIKVVNLNRHGGIPYLTVHEDLLVVCGDDESVRFYDLEFRIIAWFEDLDAGAVTSVSFSNASNVHYIDSPLGSSGVGGSSAAALGSSALAAMSSAAGLAPNSVGSLTPSGVVGGAPAKIALSDFVVGTSRALIVGMDVSTFDDPVPENRVGTLLLQGFDGAITSLLCHPAESILIAISCTGVVQAWDYEVKQLLMVRLLPSDDKPISAAFSPSGDFIAVGCESGILRILRWAGKRDLGEIACFHVRPGCGVTLLEFSPDSTTLSFADEDCCVGLFRFIEADVADANGGHAFDGVDSMRVNQGKKKHEPGPGLEPCDGTDSRNGWMYLGRHGSHSKPVAKLAFGVTVDGTARLVSVGADGMLVEYDVEESSVLDGVRLIGERKQIEFGETYPTCCVVLPATKGAREDLIVTANSEFKLRVFNANSRVCRRTALGPTYGGPLRNLVALQTLDSDVGERYLAYSTEDKVIGLVKYPLDGNPYKSMGLVAHPGEISGFAPSHDGRMLISAGGSDMSIHVWAVHTSVLDASSMAASAQSVPGIPRGLVPFLPLIEGPQNQNPPFDEIVDFFYYAQLRCQGEDTTSPRRTDGLVPLAQVPNLMRALGFFPTEQQVEEMCAEVRYSEFTTSAHTVDAINLEQFVRLYINHRPTSGVTEDQIARAFSVLGDHTQGVPQWKQLKQLLETVGEAMPSRELETCLTMLLGPKGFKGLRPTAPIDADTFATELLGLQPLTARSRHK